MKRKKKWMSEWKECDVCHIPLKGEVEFFVDGKTVWGPWGLLCPDCFRNHGVGLGCGMGQKYNGKTAELMEGGCDDTEE